MSVVRISATKVASFEVRGMISVRIVNFLKYFFKNISFNTFLWLVLMQMYCFSYSKIFEN